MSSLVLAAATNATGPTSNLTAPALPAHHAPDPNRPIYLAIHVLCMLFAWHFLVPLATLFASPNLRARLFPRDTTSNPRHTLIHRTLMALAILLVIIALVIGWCFLGDRHRILHFSLGTSAGILMVVQAGLGFWRTRITPQDLVRNTGLRKRRDGLVMVHRWLGRLVWIVATINVFVGVNLQKINDVPSLAGYVILTMVAVVLMVGGVFVSNGGGVANAPSSTTNANKLEEKENSLNSE